LHSFGSTTGDGTGPRGDLLLSGSTLYGMTANGGSSALGTMFGIGTDGTGYAVMHSFAGGAADGASPQGSLILSGSTLFGMTYAGGSANLGTVFSFPVSVPEPSGLLLATGAAAGVLVRRHRRYPGRPKMGQHDCPAGANGRRRVTTSR
jgi:uncharacterized repeat protein (TIGR03803 family)